MDMVQHVDGQQLDGRPEWRCSECGQISGTCTSCTEGGRPGLILKSLPPPHNGATAEELLNRWSSIVLRHPQYCRFRADKYLADHGVAWRHAAAASGDILRHELVKNYTTSMAHCESTLGLSKMAGGFFELPVSKRDAVRLLGVLAEATAGAYLAGDWSCVSLCGVVLLKNAFQLSSLKQTDNPLLNLLFQGLGVLFELFFFDEEHVGGGACFAITRGVLALEMEEHGRWPARWHAGLRNGLVPLGSHGSQREAKRIRSSTAAKAAAAAAASSVAAAAGFAQGSLPSDAVETVPVELLHLIARTLPQSDLYAAFGLVSRAFHGVARSTALPQARRAIVRCQMHRNRPGRINNSIRDLPDLLETLEDWQARHVHVIDEMHAMHISHALEDWQARLVHVIDKMRDEMSM